MVLQRKKKRKKKKQKKVEEKGPTPEEIAENDIFISDEIESLACILENQIITDEKLVGAAAYTRKIVIFMKPDDEEDYGVSTTVEFKLPQLYPTKQPHIECVGYTKLAIEEVHEIQGQLRKWADERRGEPMLYDLVIEGQEFMKKYNQASLGVVENVKMRKQRLVEDEKKKEKKREARRKKKDDRQRKKLQELLLIDPETEKELRMKMLEKLDKDKAEKLPSPQLSPVKEPRSSMDARVLHKVHLLLIHLLKKCVAIESSGQAEFNRHFSSLCEELTNLGVIPDHIFESCKDLATFNQSFKKAFKWNIAKAQEVEKPIISNFWNSNLQFNGNQAQQLSDAVVAKASRYEQDFIQLDELGEGGFGKVFKCQSRLDNRMYAVKKIQVKQKGLELQRVLREVTTLSRISANYVLRYYWAWIEKTGDDHFEQSLMEPSDGTPEWTKSKNFFAASGFFQDVTNSFNAFKPNASGFMSYISNCNSNSDTFGEEQVGSAAEPLYLYLVTQWCERTLRDDLESGRRFTDQEIWERFRQILEGLEAIHGLGIIHRDLKPNNIFLTHDDEVRIGDFGLATFGGKKPPPRLGFQRSDSSEYSDNTTGAGTFFYMSPELTTNVGYDYGAKVDVYALGIILFEMWYPLTTARERVQVLTALRSEGVFPENFETTHPRQAQLIQWMLKPNPIERPSLEQLKTSKLLPPRMEEEIWNNMLRTIQNPTTNFYKDFVNKMFGFARRYKTLPGHSSLQCAGFPIAEDLGQRYINHIPIHIMNEIKQQTEELFRLHGAVPLTLSLLQPFDKARPNLVDTDSIRTLERVGSVLADFELDEGKCVHMDQAGLVKILRDDLRKAFIPMVASEQILNCRTYCMGSVFDSQRSERIREFYPVQTVVADFDLVEPHSSPLSDAEVLFTCSKLLEKVCAKDMIDEAYFIRISHVELAREIFLMVGLLDEHIDFMRSHFVQNAGLDLSFLRKQLPKSYDKAKKREIKKQLQRVFNLKSVGFVEAVNKVSKTFGENSRILAHCERLLAILRFVEMWDDAIASKLVLDFTVFLNSYYEGVVFRGEISSSSRKMNHCVALGGRYDGYLRKQREIHLKTPKQSGGVGLSVLIESLVHLQADKEISRKKSNRLFVLPHKKGSMFVATVCDKPEIVAAGTKLVGDLWSAGIIAEFCHGCGSVSMDYQRSLAERSSCEWFCTILDSNMSDPTMPIVRVQVRNLVKGGLQKKREDVFVSNNRLRYAFECHTHEIFGNLRTTVFA